MKKRYIILLLTIFIGVLFVGCNRTMTESEYDNFKESFYEIFDNVSQEVNARLVLSIFLKIDNKAVQVSNEINNNLSFLENLLNKSKSKIPSEKLEEYEKFVSVVNDMRKIEDEITTKNMLDDIEEPSKEFLVFYKERMNNIGINPSELADKKIKETDTVLNTLEFKVSQYKKENSIIFDWKDVQYDIANNLDRNFVVAGVGELSDYYNYGFDDYEKDYFCVCVTPPDSKFSDRWYLYFHRQSFDKLFKLLKERDVELIATCKIPKYIYEKGQRNMALVQSVQWFGN